MSASSPGALGRGFRALLRALGLVRWTRAGRGAVQPSLACAVLGAADFATVSIVAVASPEAVVRPQIRVRNRPLASQLSITAARNVPKARKGKKAVKAAPRVASGRALPRVASAIKPKPTTRAAPVIRARKRRHVWLSTQSRVVRPAVSNVVAMPNPPRIQRSSLRPAGQKATGRVLRLAA